MELRNGYISTGKECPPFTGRKTVLSIAIAIASIPTY